MCDHVVTNLYKWVVAVVDGAMRILLNVVDDDLVA